MVKIRKAQSGDAKELYTLLNAARELTGFDSKEAYSKSWVRDVINDQKRNVTLIAEENGKMAGLLVAHMIAGRDFILNSLFVKPTYRRKGIATTLLSAFDAIAKRSHSKFTFSLVLPSNKKMQSFLDKHGHLKGDTMQYYYKERK